ncbi:thiolase-like protein [Lactarius hengduanensis]|nr:thiolase-like protein [Lactarius hengduanensis]
MVAERERVFIIGLLSCYPLQSCLTLFLRTSPVNDICTLARFACHGSAQPHRWAWAATKALLDAGITYDSVEAAFVGYVYGASTTGQAALYQLGLTGIPITNVNKNCSTGSIALVHAAALVRAGDAHCALALAPWARSSERASPDSKRGPPMPRMFGAAATEYFRKCGGGVEHLAKIATKHSLNNPYAQFRAGYNEAAVLASPQISNELTKFMCSPTSDGAACCILANEAFVHANRLENQAIELVATGLATDYLDAFAGRSAMDTVGYGMTRRLADKIFAQAGASQDDVGVVELHDCFAANELVTYPALGLCAVDDAHRFVERGDNTYGGKYVVNPSGGLEAKGHPLGATGLAMHFSITRAGPMQAPGLFDLPDARGKYGLVHNIGLGDAVVVSLLRRPEIYHADGPDGRDRLGYNHAHELRTITRADVDKVRSKSHSEGLLQLAKL